MGVKVTKFHQMQFFKVYFCAPNAQKIILVLGILGGQNLVKVTKGHQVQRSMFSFKATQRFDQPNDSYLNKKILGKNICTLTAHHNSVVQIQLECESKIHSTPPPFRFTNDTQLPAQQFNLVTRQIPKSFLEYEVFGIHPMSTESQSLNPIGEHFQGRGGGGTSILRLSTDVCPLWVGL